MTSRGPRKTVGGDYGSGRLVQARGFHQSARDLVELGGPASHNGAVVLMVMAAIAYADAITTKFKGVVNQQDHRTAPRLLREALGAQLPNRQEKFYRKLLGRKDEVNYGARSTALEEARRLLEGLDEFAAWAEGAL